MMNIFSLLVACLLIGSTTTLAFTPSRPGLVKRVNVAHYTTDFTRLYGRLTDERRKQLGVADDEDEYDLYKALENNTDPLISKIIAGSFIVVMIALLVYGVVLPYTADYGEGVCNPISSQGRC